MLLESKPFAFGVVVLPKVSRFCSPVSLDLSSSTCTDSKQSSHKDKH